TQSRTPRKIDLPASAGTLAVKDHLGKELPPIEVTDARQTLQLELTDAPVYLTPRQRNDLLLRIGQLNRLPLEIEITRKDLHTGRIVELGREEAWQASGTAEPQRILSRFRLVRPDGADLLIAQQTYLIVTDPLCIRLLPRAGQLLPVLIENPAATAFDGQLLLGSGPDTASGRQALKLAPGQTSLLTLVPAPPADASGAYTVSASIADDEGHVHCRTPARRFAPIPLASDHFQIIPDGDASVQSEQSIELVQAPAGLPVDGSQAIRITYRFAPGWKFVCLKPAAPDLQKIDGLPTHLGMWVRGDGSNNIPRMRFVDSTGQTFQPSAEKLSGTDWRYVEFPLSSQHAGHWGGANDGQIHYPIRLDTLLLIDSTARGQSFGAVYIACPMLIYSE
ncbi:MAG TPA: hypothetical protein VNL70_09810, partial [Tepidisphaeraceae bacterium]|nr:hypothetical protein [Tepidisphaeraceae bacterium]